MNKTLKWLLISLAVLIVLAVIFKSMGIVGGVKPTKVVVEKAEKRTLVETVSANGKIQPADEVKISPDVPGEITELYVHEGDSVVRGQVIAHLKPDIYQSQMARVAASVDNAKANMASAKSQKMQAQARLTEAKSVYDRTKKLYDQKVISQAEYESSLSAYEIAQSQVEAAEQAIRASEFTIQSAQASLKEASDNLGRTTIYSPIDGTIYGLKVVKGDRVVGTSQMAGTEMCRIADLHKIEVHVDVNENDIVRVHKGDTATIEVEAYQDRKFKGVVTEISNAASTSIGVSTDQVTNFVVKIKVLNSSYADLSAKLSHHESPFRAGMNASVEIITDTKPDVLCVPVRAVTKDRENKAKKIEATPKAEEAEKKKEEKKDDAIIVFKFVDGKAKKVIVKTGIQDDKFMEITEGVNAGDEIITDPFSAVSRTLKDDDPVKKSTKEEIFEEKK